MQMNPRRVKLIRSKTKDLSYPTVEYAEGDRVVFYVQYLRIRKLHKVRRGGVRVLN